MTRLRAPAPRFAPAITLRIIDPRLLAFTRQIITLLVLAVTRQIIIGSDGPAIRTCGYSPDRHGELNLFQIGRVGHNTPREWSVPHFGTKIFVFGLEV